MSIFCLRQAENRATEFERNVTKLQKEVDKLEGMQNVKLCPFQTLYSFFRSLFL